MDRPMWVDEEDEIYIPPKYTKYCFVPICKNNSSKTPDKHFFHVPYKNKADWCRAVGKPFVPKYPLVICEDHLNLEYDLENYKSWKITKGKAKLRPRVPFLKNISKSTETITEDEPGPSRRSPESCPRPSFEECSVMCTPMVAHKSIQVKPVLVDHAVNCVLSKINKQVNQSVQEATFHSQPSGKGSMSEVSEAEASYDYEPTTTTTPTPVLNGRLFLLNLIERKPFQYIGIPKKLYWVIDSLSNAHKDITKLDIIITLYRIKSNDTFMKIGDLFQISQSTLWRMFEKTIHLLSAFFKQFIEWPSAFAIKMNLPGSFTTSVEYANVQAIIDCFEIEVEKPSNPIHQSLTWSQYKNCNTIKYLISATPDGLINFISKGYGGRISDVSLVQECGFLDVVPPRSYILADRGFKHLETALNKKFLNFLNLTL